VEKRHGRLIAALITIYVVSMCLQIEMGSTNVRVGSTIFGAREYPKKN
jgi:hypothetical protein